MRKTEPDRHIAASRRVTWAGLVTNLVLAAVKFTAGSLGHSQAVVADGAHSLADLVSDLAVLVGLRFWSAPADSGHPYGHRRIETLVTIAIGAMLIVMAAGLAIRAISAVVLVHGETPGWIALTAALLSIGVKEALYRWTVQVGRRAGSPALIANAWHHRSDSFSSVPVVLAVSTAMLHPRMVFVDHVGALVVAGMIVKVACRILLDAIGDLIDRSAGREDLKRIEKIARSIPGVRSIHALRSRRISGGLFVDLHIQVDGALSVREGHRISGVVERAILKHGPRVLDVVVHLEPSEAQRTADGTRDRGAAT
ncbi:MAG TPA: cation transporter [Kiritimatiellae bacterium]|nr:cation transporter [Kiritimatiellia bacterium]